MTTSGLFSGRVTLKEISTQTLMMTVNINAGYNIDVESTNTSTQTNITIGESNLITYITGSNSSLNPSIPDHNSRYIIVTASTASYSYISLPYVRESGDEGDLIAPAGYMVTYKFIDVQPGTTGSLIIDGHHDYMDEQHSYILTSYYVNFGYVTFVANGDGDWFVVASGHGKDASH